MLDKKLDRIIQNAFQLSHVKHPDSDLTEKEYNDAVYDLNCMLQEWNNDGFRLFKIKTGYLPLMPGQSEYLLGQDAFKKIDAVRIRRFEQIGATKIQLNTVNDMTTGINISVMNATEIINKTIVDFDEDKAEVTFNEPAMQPIADGTDVFYGSFHIAHTPNLVYDEEFSQIPYFQQDVPPRIGDSMLLQFNGEWVKVQVTGVSDSMVDFVPRLAYGDITDPRVYFGAQVNHTTVKGNYELGYRKVLLSDSIPDEFDTVAFRTPDSRDVPSAKRVIESRGEKEVILTTPLSSDVLIANGEIWLDAKRTYKFDAVLELDDLESFSQPGSKLKILDYVRVGEQDYVIISDDTTGLHVDLVWRANASAQWQMMSEAVTLRSPKLFAIKGRVYLAQSTPDLATRLADVTEGGYTPVGPAFWGGIGWHVSLRGLDYFIGAQYYPNSVTRDICSFDGMVFSTLWKGAVENADNAVEFKGRLYMGAVGTAVTPDMREFATLPVHADSRVVIDNILFGVNADELCNFTVDGTNFNQLPFVFMRNSAWTQKDGMAIMTAYNMPEFNQPNLSQVFLANHVFALNRAHAVLKGLCFKIQILDDKAYFVTPEEVAVMDLLEGRKATDAYMYCYGEAIGRPQEIMNIVRYDKDGRSEFPIEEKALADFTRLPHGHGADGVVSCCFLREAEDAKFMVWGTPKKFGEVLKFSYVEPMALLLDPRAVPDFPDEYVSAVIDGLAYHLACHYGAPAEDTAVLQQKAELSKEKCMLHDNESTSYRITPNIRQ